MSKCNDHWCDYFGKGSDKCDRCEKKESEKDKPDLQVLLKRRQVERMKHAKDTGKKQDYGQAR